MVIFENLQTKVSKQCDVLVCGGGFAGISAALASARQGKKTILLEKQYILGGLGTAGLVTIYLPLCDGVGHQVSFGIAEELFRLSISMGAESDYPENWLDYDDVAKRTEKDKRFQVRYNPQLFALLIEQLLEKEGVEIIYGSYAVAVKKDADRIESVIIENKSGRQAIKAKSFVDATGDCDLAYYAGADTEEFKQGNILAAWYYYWDGNKYDLNTLGIADIPEEQKGKNNQVEVLVSRRFLGLDGDELSDMIKLSHQAILKDVLKRKQKDRFLMPTSIATIPQIRMTRKLVGEYVLHDVQMHAYFEDSIGMISDWRKRGPVYEIPFSTLYSKGIKNLIVAGRCISVTDSMWDISRVIPACAVTGQAAGTAAALTDDVTELDIRELQETLIRAGVVLHEIRGESS